MIAQVARISDFFMAQLTAGYRLYSKESYVRAN